MMAAVPVMSSVPTIAWIAPPPSPTTLRIELVKNCTSKRAEPFTTTVTSSETSGVIAIRKAPVTRAVTKRSVALREPSTCRLITTIITR